jgi:hypothetical protein
MTFIRHLAIRRFFSDCTIGEPLIFLTHSKVPYVQTAHLPLGGDTLLLVGEKS